jgi:pro-sigmaK processing inhibitor BofA
LPDWVVPLSLCGVFALLVLIQVIVKAPKPVQRAAGGVLTGLCALAAVNLTGFFTGVSLPLSPLTIGVSGAAGIPGVTMLLLLNLIIR